MIIISSTFQSESENMPGYTESPQIEQRYNQELIVLILLLILQMSRNLYCVEEREQNLHCEMQDL
jgi:hypothetical protein